MSMSPSRLHFPREVAHIHTENDTSISKWKDTMACTRALVRDVPRTFAEQAIRSEADSTIDMAVAMDQHNEYEKVLENLGINLIRVEAAHDLPDSVFIEDTVVSISNRAVVTHIGHPAREKEALGVAALLGQLSVHDELSFMPFDQDTTLDGGDVLFTGEEVFVGASRRSSEKGISFLRAALSEAGIPVHAVRVPGGTLHLKSMLSLVGYQTLCIVDSEEGRALEKLILESSSTQDAYRFIRVPHMASANCLFVNGTVVARSDADLSESFSIIQHNVDKVVGVDMSEFAKADGALTCCSVLLP